MKYLPPRRKFWSVSLHKQSFSRYNVVENLNNTEHLLVTSTMHTLLVPETQMLVRFDPRIAVFEIQDC